MADTQKIRILVVDDHPIVRRGLRALLDGEPDLEIVAEAADGLAGVAAFTEHRPDVTLMDLRLPGLDGPQAIVALRRIDPAANVIVLTSFDADEDIYRAVQAGARGYLLKGTFPGAIADAIRSVHAGRRLIAPEAAARLAERLGEPSLTTRELSVLALAARGLSNKEIAAALALSEDTVKTYLSRAYGKLGVGDRTEAVMLAVQRGLIAVT
jgi:two-component system NarL family response regulator